MAGDQGTPAYRKHVSHVRDARRVEAQRLVERIRPLPSRKEGVRSGARCKPGQWAWGDGGIRTACRWGGGGSGARAERTRNMPPMLVTLDVPKLSGWLNVDASCRVGRRALTMRGAVRAGRREGGGRAQATCTGRTRLKAGRQGTRGAHVEHVVHVRDAGRVEAQRLVER